MTATDADQVTGQAHDRVERLLGVSLASADRPVDGAVEGLAVFLDPTGITFDGPLPGQRRHLAWQEIRWVARGDDDDEVRLELAQRAVLLRAEPTGAPLIEVVRRFAPSDVFEPTRPADTAPAPAEEEATTGAEEPSPPIPPVDSAWTMESLPLTDVAAAPAETAEAETAEAETAEAETAEAETAEAETAEAETAEAVRPAMVAADAAAEAEQLGALYTATRPTVVQIRPPSRTELLILAPAVGIVAVILLLMAITSGAPVTGTFASSSPQAVLEAASAASVAAGTCHVQVRTETAGGVTTITGDSGPASGTVRITDGGVTTDLVALRGVLWIRTSAAGLVSRFGLAPKAAARGAGRWVVVPVGTAAGTGLEREVAGLCAPSTAWRGNGGPSGVLVTPVDPGVLFATGGTAAGVPVEWVSEWSRPAASGAVGLVSIAVPTSGSHAPVEERVEAWGTAPGDGFSTVAHLSAWGRTLDLSRPQGTVTLAGLQSAA